METTSSVNRVRGETLFKSNFKVMFFIAAALAAALIVVEQALPQTTDDSISQASDSSAAMSVTDATVDAVEAAPIGPPKKQNQLQATSLNGAAALGGGDSAVPGVSERVPGMAKVGSSGAASYAIPITIPPGIVVPQLAFAYDSQGTKNSDGSNGLLGMGWSLQGLSGIQRCPRTVAQDGFRGTINYDTNDKFCLNGARLMLISTNKTYGQDGAEYRTEVDNFIKVISYGQAGNGPAFFRAWTKQGEMMEFGGNESSDQGRIEAQGKTSVRVWALSKMQDAKGNYFTVTYFEDNNAGEYRPTRIDYTGNTGIATTRRVEFAYSPDVGSRSDVTLTYVGGSLIKVTKLLTKVQTFAPPPAGGTAELVREYRLTYQVGTATKRSRLTSITECAADSSCLPPSIFTWQEGGDGNFVNSSMGDSSFGWNNNQVWMADVNGDGIIDIITNNNNQLITYLSQPNGTYAVAHTATPSPWANSTVRVGDFDGDGKQDLVFAASGQLRYLFSQGNGTYNLVTQNKPANWSDGNAWAGDFNGDGRTDLVSHNNGKLIFAFSNFINGAGNFTSPSPAQNVPPTGMDSSKTWIGDVNGDGKADIITYSGNNLTSIYNISDTNGTYTWTSDQPAAGWGDCLNSSVGITCWVADYNGDGNESFLGSGKLLGVRSWILNSPPPVIAAAHGPAAAHRISRRALSHHHAPRHCPRRRRGLGANA